MTHAVFSDGLLARLPPVRGRTTENAPLAGITWFRVGGPAEVMFRPADRDDLISFIRAKPGDIPVTMLGIGSNLMVRDGGIPGVVIRLGEGFSDVTFDGVEVTAGAGAHDVHVAILCRNQCVAGLEFLSGIPGTIGGALAMNAGAYGGEMSDIVLSADALDPNGRVHELNLAALGFTYRHTAAPSDWLFLSARMQGEPGARERIAARMREISAARKSTQPIRTRTGGSTFKNPPDAAAWELIDAAGCRGLRRGGAKVSEVHCNFLINTGHATANDLEGLGDEVRERVRVHSGIELEWEIRRIGRPGDATVGEAA
ncbi:MAG: UDP-N-acetylmuramate dehydrogenase [Pseudomonadota bacterium]|nr:UDP-N-acetylmuramate dehydrogenase [Pseudomonadota bacterium]